MSACVPTSRPACVCVYVCDLRLICYSPSRSHVPAGRSSRSPFRGFGIRPLGERKRGNTRSVRFNWAETVIKHGARQSTASDNACVLVGIWTARAYARIGAIVDGRGELQAICAADKLSRQCSWRGGELGLIAMGV